MDAKNKYTPIIGLEVHVELKTKSKMFCGCSADYFGKKPNTHVCPVCLGLAGALPVPNRTAIEWCVMIGLALNSEIPLFSKFDRKNYFYPDLPKGYQISQYDQPFAVNGYIKLTTKTIRIRRVHMEEDTGKLIHAMVNGESVSLIDFNRSGVPLVEIVTEPDFESAQEVVEYLKTLQQIVRYLGVSNADMEKGDMRLEPNISVQKTRNSKLETRNDELPKYKVEVKNINSFRFVERAITYEIERQIKILEAEKLPAQETRGWNEEKNETVTQRSKEEAHDYRYFPEPDIPPIRWGKEQIRQLADQIPELPDQKNERFQKEYQLSRYNSEIVTREKETADFFEEAVKVGREVKIDPKEIANVMINTKTDIKSELPATLVQTIMQLKQKVSLDEKELEKIAQSVFNENPKAIQDYKNGKKTVIMFLVGQVMRKIRKNVDAGKIKEMIEKQLKTA